MSELIDRERFSADMRDFQNRVGIWRDEAEDTETRTRADAALATIIETKLILDKQPTIPAPRWHRVEDELPNEFDTVIVCGRMKYDHEKDYEVFVDAAEYGPYSHDRWVTWNDWHEGQEEFKITHWMPLPEPPKEGV